METLHIALISTNTFTTPPIGYGGEVAIYDLAWCLDLFGHQVDLYAAPGSWEPPHGRLILQRASHNQWPQFIQFEKEIYGWHREEILRADVVHDFSHSGSVAEALYNQDQRTNFVKSLIGGVYNNYSPAMNAIVWSKSWRDRAVRGATDYEGTPYESLGSYTGQLKDAHVVYGGVDTERYAFEPDKEDYFLWMTRWHPSKGYHVAIELARRTGIPLVLAGDHPDNTVSPDHRQGALHALELAKGLDNVRFEWLPPGGDHHAAKIRLYQKARALLYPVQFHEPFGLVVVEALSCGTPVVAMNRGSMPELVQDGKTGFVCDSESQFEWAVQDVERIHPADVRRDAEERFDRRIMAENYVLEYERVIKGEVWGL